MLEFKSHNLHFLYLKIVDILVPFSLKTNAYIKFKFELIAANQINQFKI